MALIWKLLMTTKEIGGLILPKIRLYYWASQLRTVVEMKRLVLLNRTPGILISRVQCLSQQSQRKFNIIHGLNKHCRYGMQCMQLKGKVAGHGLCLLFTRK